MYGDFFAPSEIPEAHILRCRARAVQKRKIRVLLESAARRGVRLALVDFELFSEIRAELTRKGYDIVRVRINGIRYLAIYLAPYSLWTRLMNAVTI